MGAAGLPERLDHLYSVGELDRGRGDVAEQDIHLRGLLRHAAHRQDHDQDVQGQVRHGEQTQPPVHEERVDDERDGGRRRRGRLHGCMGDECVQGTDVVLHGLAHPSRVGVAEPRQRGGGDAGDQAVADEGAQFQVRVVGDPESREHQQRLGGEGTDEPCGHGGHVAAVG